MSETTTSKRTLVGRVVSDRMDKTVTVVVERRVKHAIYDKIMMRSSKYHAHDDGNEARRVTWSKSRSVVRYQKASRGLSPSF
jgi:small subunit ribosomal protein S17